MSSVRISVVSGSRAEFGQLLPLLCKLRDNRFFELDFIVTGSHLCNAAGNTINEIEECNINVSKVIVSDYTEDNSSIGIASQIGDLIIQFANYFSECRPNILLLIGDRYEMYAVGVAASTLLIPIAHLCGGSTTSGAIDEVYRHSLSKMSQIHFTTCDTYRKRVIQLGEAPDRVYNVGSLAIENCLNVDLLTENEIKDYVGLPYECKYCVVTFHPETLNSNGSEDELCELIEALDYFSEFSYIITLSNSDSGGHRINEIWKNAGLTRDNFYVVNSLGMKRYLSALKYSEMMIGNSSSGTTEGPAMHIPIINIGDRQRGRIFADSTIHCDADSNSIIKAIEQARSDSFKAIAQKATNPFGDGNTSDRIVTILEEICRDNISCKKDFYDINFEV